MKAVAAVIRSPGADFSIETVEVDEPRVDEIQVRVSGVGICHTDVATRDRLATVSPPAVLGHEGCGIVEKVGANVRKVRPGDRVVMTFLSCGECAGCLHNEPAYCRSFGQLNVSGLRADGSKSIHNGDEEISGNYFGQSSFASVALAYERNVVKVPEGVPLELMGPLGCGVQTGAGAIFNSLNCRPGSSVLVVGVGAVGLSAVLAAVVRGCATIIAAEPFAQRRELALSLGATHALDPVSDDMKQKVRAILPDGVDYVFDTSGLSSSLTAAVGCMGKRARMGLVAIPPVRTDCLSVPLSEILSGAWSFHGILEGDSVPDEFIPEMIRLYQAGKFPFDKMITTYPFSDINRAIKEQHDGKCTKAVLLFD